MDELTKLLIAVKSCVQHLDAGYHTVIRETWGKDAKALGIDLKFFVGQGLDGQRSIKYQPDEVALAVKDDYNSLPFKTREICLWAQSKAVDYIFLCDTDTFLVPKLMLQSGFQTADYTGRFNGNTTSPIIGYRAVDRSGASVTHPRLFPWASGGYGYFLSKRASREVAYANPIVWAEDLFVGQCIGPLAAKGEMSILDTTELTYSNHFPAHIFKSGYDLKFRWMESNYGI